MTVWVYAGLKLTRWKPATRGNKGRLGVRQSLRTKAAWRAERGRELRDNRFCFCARVLGGGRRRDKE